MVARVVEAVWRRAPRQRAEGWVVGEGGEGMLGSKRCLVGKRAMVGVGVGVLILFFWWRLRWTRGSCSGRRRCEGVG